MVALTLVSFLWAFSFPLIKGTLTGLPPALVAFVRLLLSLVVFMPLIRVRGFRGATAAALVGIGAVQFGLMYVLYIASYQFLPAHTIVLLTTTTPLFVTLFNDALTRRFHARFMLSALLAVCAGLVIEYPDQPLRASISGVLLLQGSNLAFAFGQVAYVRLSRRHVAWSTTRSFAYLYIGAVVVAALFAFRTGIPADVTFDTRQALTLLYLGIVASGLCFFLWNFGARQVGAGTLAVMNNLKIPLGMIASLLLLGERTDYLRLLAGVGLMGLALFLDRHAPQRVSRRH
ncbi:MAG: EamA family transporter [Chitinivibrionales bacterium]|nr:EamA family transporter [Chitinivibrionales bacterium]